MKQNKVEAWDGFWEHHNEDKSQSGADYWTSLVWQAGLDYWQEVFERLSPGRKMLECGAGSARVSLHMAGRGYDCTMLDNSHEGLKTGMASFEKAGLKGSFVLGDVEKLDFPDNTFDVLYSGGLIEHFRDVRPVFREMVRVLRPGGLFTADIIPKRFSCMSLTYFLSSLVKFTSHIIRLKFRGSIRESGRNFPFYENSISLKEYRKIARESGLENVIAAGTGMFPPLPLPKRFHPVYAGLMKKMLPAWRKFDRSNSWFAGVWGARYSIYGVKKE
jgi:ubiquinone/menaquinone biosynthesis C-methylase UbiE